MDDIVTRLRAYYYQTTFRDLQEAADEIERLRSMLRHALGNNAFDPDDDCPQCRDIMVRYGNIIWHTPIMDTGAREIERLRNNVDSLTNLYAEMCDQSDRYARDANTAEEEAKRLRARVSQLEQLGDDLERVAVHETQGQCIGHRAWKPLKAWQEARRG